MRSLSSDLISYVVRFVHDEGGTLGKTKLVKLLYLVDVEHYRRFRKTLTSWRWKFHHYGPYAFEIEPILARMPLDFDEDEVSTRKGHRAKVYTGRADTDEFEDSLQHSQKAVIDRVLKTWTLEDLPAILDYVYFETEPMQDVQRGEELDFSKVLPRQVTLPPSTKPKSDPKWHADMRKRFDELVASKKRSNRFKITPPIYDEVYYKALEAMDAEDSE